LTFLRGLLAGRSHLAFLVGLAAAIAIARATSGLGHGSPTSRALRELAQLARVLPLRPPAPPSDRERRLALSAWSYLERETDPRTGLARSIAGYPSITLWDFGSQLLAILAAEDLGIVSSEEAHRRLARAITTLAELPLCDPGLPNKAYHTATLAMVGYDNAPTPRGIGWSALDVGRALVPLALVVRRTPELTPLVRRAVDRWNLDALSDGAALRGGTRRSDGILETYQEGRLGYEQYAARALMGWGVPVAEALDFRAHLAFQKLDGQLVPRDDRLPRDYGGAHAAVLSEPWVLQGLEGGLDAVSVALARAVLAAQERRFASTGRLTAVSEDALDRPPGFAYSAVLNGTEPWVAFSPDGTPTPARLTFSTKAAFGWAAIFSGDYPERLLAAAEELEAPEGGLWAGRYDADGAPNRILSLNTNAVVLEALAYRVRGPAFRASPRGDSGVTIRAGARP
jgi:hypothetical protein